VALERGGWLVSREIGIEIELAVVSTGDVAPERRERQTATV
jgi:hypothetical protein